MKLCARFFLCLLGLALIAGFFSCAGTTSNSPYKLESSSGSTASQEDTECFGVLLERFNLLSFRNEDRFYESEDLWNSLPKRTLAMWGGGMLNLVADNYEEKNPFFILVVKGDLLFIIRTTEVGLHNGESRLEVEAFFLSFETRSTIPAKDGIGSVSEYEAITKEGTVFVGSARAAEIAREVVQLTSPVLK